MKPNKTKSLIKIRKIEVIIAQNLKNNIIYNFDVNDFWKERYASIDFLDELDKDYKSKIAKLKQKLE